MKATNFAWDAPAWARTASIGNPATTKRGDARDRPPTLLERVDRWLWKQHVREREAYLADSKDIFELEERIRRLERAVGSFYC